MVTAAWSRRLRITQRSLLTAIYGGSDTGVLVGQEDEDTWWQVVAERLGINTWLLTKLRDEIANAGVWDDWLLAFLRSVQGRVRITIISNAWPHVRVRLTEDHVDEVAHEVVLSCEVGCAKPDPRIYRLALDRLGVAPERALLIDDTSGHVAAAVSAGLQAHLHVSRVCTIAAIEQFLGERDHSTSPALIAPRPSESTIGRLRRSSATRPQSRPPRMSATA